MSIQRYLDTAPLYELVRYDETKEYRKKCTPYEGSPRKHPYDPDRLLLFPDPVTDHAEFFEFRVEDIGYVEDLGNIVNESGKNLHRIRMWVKKESIGICYTPFTVE
ncbi:MAG: hypothetical protein K9L68_14255 [Spirochaetales bacterium]|nr:hypothetical protein [Spirochaetales bacterium]MCF7939756.1 hypothetical protein [Spirochaetales bacterium]